MCESGRERSQKFEQILAVPTAAAEIWGAPAAAATRRRPAVSGNFKVFSGGGPY